MRTSRRQPNQKRRGKARPERDRWRLNRAVQVLTIASQGKGGNAMSLCQVSEPITNVLAYGMLIVLLISVIAFAASRVRVREPTIPPVPTLAVPSQRTKEKLPSIVYFSTTAATRKRCFHASEACHSLSKVADVRSATACKICVKPTPDVSNPSGTYNFLDSGADSSLVQRRDAGASLVT